MLNKNLIGMKKIVRIVISVSFIMWCVSGYGQMIVGKIDVNNVPYNYIGIRVYDKSVLAKTKFNLSVDYGQPLSVNSDHLLYNTKGEPMTFVSYVEIINWLDNQGWEPYMMFEPEKLSSNLLMGSSKFPPQLLFKRKE